MIKEYKYVLIVFFIFLFSCQQKKDSQQKKLEKIVKDKKEIIVQDTVFYYENFFPSSFFEKYNTGIITDSLKCYASNIIEKDSIYYLKLVIITKNSLKHIINLMNRPCLGICAIGDNNCYFWGRLDGVEHLLNISKKYEIINRTINYHNIHKFPVVYFDGFTEVFEIKKNGLEYVGHDISGIVNNEICLIPIKRDEIKELKFEEVDLRDLR